MICIILSKCIFFFMNILYILVNIYVVFVVLEMKLKGIIFDMS